MSSAVSADAGQAPQCNLLVVTPGQFIAGHSISAVQVVPTRRKPTLS